MGRDSRAALNLKLVRLPRARGVGGRGRVGACTRACARGQCGCMGQVPRLGGGGAPCSPCDVTGVKDDAPRFGHHWPAAHHTRTHTGPSTSALLLTTKAPPGGSSITFCRVPASTSMTCGWVWERAGCRWYGAPQGPGSSGLQGSQVPRLLQPSFSALPHGVVAALKNNPRRSTPQQGHACPPGTRRPPARPPPPASPRSSG